MIRSIIPNSLTRTMNLVRDLFSLSTPQFVLFMVGISMLVISAVHMPRREHSDQLESRLNSLRGQEKVLSQRLTDSYARLKRSGKGSLLSTRGAAKTDRPELDGGTYSQRSPRTVRANRQGICAIAARSSHPPG